VAENEHKIRCCTTYTKFRGRHSENTTHNLYLCCAKLITIKITDMQTIENYSFNGKKVLIRVDFNVPLKDGLVTDDTRIKGALLSLKKILSDGGSVIIMSHLGRPDGEKNPKYTLKPVVAPLAKLLGVDVQFATDCIGEEVLKMKQALKTGEVLLLENVRYYKEEESKGKTQEEVDKQLAFAKQLAEGADCYVNDAFGTAHRAHASTTIVAKFFPNDKLFGFLINSELLAMDKVLKESQKPFTAIMGGAKVSDKIKVIENLLPKVDNLIIGGGMTYTFIKAQGGTIGSSLVEEDKLALALEIIEKAKANNVNLILPVDQVLADKFDNGANTMVTDINDGKDGWMGLDVSDKTIALFEKVIGESKTILWNGPVGVFEMPNFQKGTVAIAKAIADATQKGAFSLVGGGDSVAAVNKFNLADKVSYVSTGGGAMLEYIEGRKLPGITEIRGF